MSTQSDSQAIGRLPRPRGRWALVMWLLIVSGATLGTVLFANDARNWKLLQHRLGLDRPTKEVQRVHKTARVKTRSAAQWFMSMSPVMPLAGLEAAVDPAETCRSLARPEQETPQFTVDSDGNWQCLAFWAASAAPDAAAVFVQVRGDSKQNVTSWRMKLSKAETDGTDILQRGLSMIAGTIQPNGLSEDMWEGIDQQMMQWQDFYRLLGPYIVTFRQEQLDRKRFNLLALKKRVDSYPLVPSASVILAVPRR